MRTGLKLVPPLLWLAAAPALNAQVHKEANLWHFGNNAGIDFNSGSPVAITNSGLSSIEGTSSMCEGTTGNLLLYSDGLTVYNRLNNAMPNGSGLLGNSSSTQSGLIVRQPGSTTIYYVFSVDQLGGSNGLRYSVVDMTLAGGFGDVTSKNVLLLTPTCEKVTAVKHCNGFDYWILTHHFGSDSIFAFPLTSTGIGTPVVSNVGWVISGTSSNARGEFKLSSDGRFLAAAYDHLGGQLYSFDNSTGVVSGAITLATSVQRYGVCFSPDNSKLYMTNGWQGRDIIQYDMAAANIPASAVTVGTTAATYIGSIQSAPDGKMYVATYGLQTLGQINNPNALGVACNYVDVGFNVGNTVRWGLPNFPVDVIGAAQTQDSTTICQGDTALLQAGPGSNYVWSTGATTSSIEVVDSGVYYVDWVNNTCSLSDTFVVTVSIPPTVSIAASDTALCLGESAVLNGSGASTYVWSPGGTGQSITVTPNSTTVYTLIGAHSSGCADTTSVTIVVNALPTVSISPSSTSICAGDSLVLMGAGASTYVWLPGSIPGSPAVVYPTSSQTYSVTGVDDNGCEDMDSVAITVLPSPTIDASPDQAICQNDVLVLGASGGATYLWEPGSLTGDSIQVMPLVATTYTVTGTGANGCQSSAQVLVIVNDCTPETAVHIPNAFSPNGDGVNDMFGIVFDEGFTLSAFRIFNRWGELVFESDDINAAWNGDYGGVMQPLGSYTYMVAGSDPDGQQLLFSGSVALLR